MPGVQNPHCSPWHSEKPCWIGSSSPSRARPSTVSTRCPSAIAASTVQDFTGSSSSQSTQAPQLDVSQPQCDPVRPSSSLMKWISSSLGSTTLVYSVPLTLTAICTSGSPPACWRLAGPGQRAAQRPGGELAREVALVVGGAALV